MRKQPCRLQRLLPRFVTVAVLVLPFLSGTVFAAPLVTNQIQSLSSSAQTNVPVTFGQIFKAGAVPAGETLSATLNGQSITLQVDAKATNPDGSLRHAVLSTVLPTLAANSTNSLVISSSSTGGSGAGVSLTDLLATGYDASASFVINSVTYTADAKTLLTAANAANDCAPWNTQCNVWLSGPVVSEWVVGGPVRDSSGNPNPNIEVYFDVRAYAGIPITQVRTNIVVENSWAYLPQAIINYNVTLKSGSNTYADGNVTDYPYTRWHHILWYGTPPQTYVRQDTAYIESTGAISVYPTLSPDIAGLTQFCAPAQHCDQTRTMGNTGAQPAIGPLPAWTTRYIVDPEHATYLNMLADDSALGAYSIHYRDQVTGWPLNIANHPYVTTVAWGYARGAAGADPTTWGKDLLPTCSGCGDGFYGTDDPDVYDTEHEPEGAYVPYMVTGSFYFEQELDYINTYNELFANPGYRNFSQGLVWDAQGVTRGKAWTLRNVLDADYLAPDSDPLKAQFNAEESANITDFTNHTINNPNAQPLHGVSNMAYQNETGMAPWQDDFFTWEMGHLVDQGWPGAQALLNWSASFQIGLMDSWQSDPTDGFCWVVASDYDTIMRASSSAAYYTTWEEVNQATNPTLYGLSCNGTDYINALTTLEGTPWEASEMVGYPYSPTGFPANLQIGLSSTYASSDTGAQEAWTLYANRVNGPTDQEWADAPQFDTIPRALPPLPNVSLFATPDYVATAGQSVTLTWNASDASDCTAAWTSQTGTSGAQSVSVNAKTSYSITCTGVNGSATQTTTVTLGTPSAGPTITNIANQWIPDGSSSAPLAFSVTGTGSLTVFAQASDPPVFPASGITISSGCGTSSLNCTITVTPAANQVGTGVVALIVQDNTARYAETDFGVNSTNNAAPTAFNGAFSTTTDQTVYFQLTASAPGNPPLTYAIVANPTHGTIVLDATTGSFQYTPDNSYDGTDSFTFTAANGAAVSNVATETAATFAGSTTPVAEAGSVSTMGNTPISGNLLVINPANLALTYHVSTQPLHGMVTVNASTGAFTYTPTSGFTGQDDFLFDATSGSVTTNIAQETITVTGAGQTPSPPVATAGSVKTTENTAVNGSLAATGTGPLTYAVVAKPGHGTVTVTAASGAFTYTPASGFSGADTITFTAANAGGVSNVATESATVTVSSGGAGSTGKSGGGALGLLGLGLLGFTLVWRCRWKPDS